MTDLKVESPSIDLNDLPKINSSIHISKQEPILSSGYAAFFREKMLRDSITPYKNEITHTPELDEEIKVVFECMREDCASLGLEEDEINKLVPQMVHIFYGADFRELNKDRGDTSRNWGGVRNNEIHVVATNLPVFNKYLIIHEAWHLMTHHLYNIRDYNSLKFDKPGNEGLKDLFDERNKILDQYESGQLTFDRTRELLKNERFKDLSDPEFVEMDGYRDIGKNRTTHFTGINEALTDRLALDTINRHYKRLGVSDQELEQLHKLYEMGEGYSNNLLILDKITSDIAAHFRDSKPQEVLDDLKKDYLRSRQNRNNLRILREIYGNGILTVLAGWGHSLIEEGQRTKSVSVFASIVEKIFGSKGVASLRRGIIRYSIDIPGFKETNLVYEFLKTKNKRRKQEIKSLFKKDYSIA